MSNVQSLGQFYSSQNPLNSSLTLNQFSLHYNFFQLTFKLVIQLELLYFLFLLNFVAAYDCNCDSDESLIVKACGIRNPVPITSSSNSLRIVFKTDGSRNAIGFKVSWFTDTIINSIQSPNYPLNYPYNAYEVK